MMPFLMRSANAATSLGLLFLPTIAGAQSWRDALPPGTPGQACSDVTRAKALLLVTEPDGTIATSSWWFDGTSYSPAAPSNQPSPVSWGELAHDVLRGRSVCFVPAGPNSETWEHDGAVWQQLTPNTVPAIAYGRLVFMPTLGTTLLVGDDGNTWSFDGLDWSLLTPSTSPPARAGCGLGYDPIRQRVVLFGGFANQMTLQDTWEFDGANWTQIVSPTTPPRGLARMTFDATRGDMVARIETNNSFDWDWTFDGSDWTQLPTVLASNAWSSRSLITSPTNGRAWWVSAFGSATRNHLVDELQGASWVPLITTYRPPARFGGGAAVDARRDELVLFGGAELFVSRPSNDQWIRSGGLWWQHQLLPRPAARLFHGFVHDAARNRFVLFGGYDGSGYRNDTWEFIAGQWQYLGGVGPAARERAGMVYDPLRKRVVLFGGRGPSLLADLWTLDANGWSVLNTVGAPGPRFGHGMTYDAAHDRIVVFGGEDAQGALDETWTLSGSAWTQITTPGPQPRSEPALAYDPFGGDIVLVGGRDGATVLSDRWVLSGSTWTQVVNGPPARPRFAGNLVAVPSSARLELHRGADYMAIFGQAFPRPYYDQVYREAGPQPRVARHGVGCPTSTGIPDLAPVAGSVPALGTVFALEITSTPATSVTWIGLGTRIDTYGQATLPLDLQAAGLTGCYLWLTPAIFIATTTVAGAQQVTVAIPANPSLSGSLLAAQGITLDTTASNGFGAVSNAIVATLR